MLFEQHLVTYCAPTLASLKTGNLFNHTYQSETELDEQLEKWNLYLCKKGIFLLELYRNESKALIYVYRRSHLITDLNRPGVEAFLAEYGYRTADVDYAVGRLRDRVRNMESFPHEIGLFLGYPLEDVDGFIRNGGRNCKCTVYWKVYGNEREKLKMFERYKKCERVYRQEWEGGRSVLQLTVTV